MEQMQEGTSIWKTAQPYTVTQLSDEIANNISDLALCLLDCLNNTTILQLFEIILNDIFCMLILFFTYEG